MRVRNVTSSLETTRRIATPSCGSTKPKNNDQDKVKLATAGAVLAALGICAACCLLPAVLIGFGIVGSFVSSLDALAPYKWVLVAITAALLGYGFYSVYWKPKKTCAAGAECTVCKSGRSVRVALWIGTALAVSGVVYGYLEPWLTHH
jgi:mercuric ion transport protein